MPDSSDSKHSVPLESIRVAGILAFIYILLLGYGTLFPLNDWRVPVSSPLDLMLQRGLNSASRSDIVTNILIYIPFGLLLMRTLSNRRCALCMIPIVVLASMFISLSLEYLQAHLPGRVPSVADLILNTGGGFIGALIALSIRSNTKIGARLKQLRSRYILPGHLANIGLFVLGIWALSQLSPLVPSIDMDNLRKGVKPLLHTLLDPTTIEWVRLIEYALGITVLCVLSRTLTRNKADWLWLSLAFFLAVLLLKIPVVSRQLSAEALLGTIIGVNLAFLIVRLPKSLRSLLTTCALFGAVLTAGIYVSPDTATLPLFTFNWVPFESHLSNDLIGIIDILGGLWPFLALSYLALIAGTSHRIFTITSGAIIIFVGVFALEWHQQDLPGRSGDLTDVILAVFAWIGLWIYEPLAARRKSAPAISAASLNILEKPLAGARWATVSLLVLLLCVGLLWLIPPGSHNTPLADNDEPLLPDASELPPVELPGFRYAHPRLPAPSPEQISLIKRNNPRYFKQHKKRAKNGEGKLYSVVLSAFVEPGSQDLNLLHRRLMELKLSWRGHQQAKPLAIAYDWLYDQWNPEQRMQLRLKIIEAGNYLIERIRVKQRLSPYNVFLYNSPFQALVATTLSVYGDDPDAELPMRWTHDYWKNRVLPVWRQVMGNNGGWHEGGEYVGIGIGQAIYQVPAMWRTATGEDLFRTVPGIRGFLDFLVYRTRPDGTHMRWGDAAFFDRKVPDRIPLAIEYSHRAAYSLKRCPRAFQPTSWPWGPLSTDALCDQNAVRSLPLQKHLDGIGMVIARSGWDEDSTYLTFKAGDNFWSHSHLDQGAFTLFKNGPLAIDSGFYGPKYGSDHHMNYSYQAIAHNVITVTDPEDKVPAPPKKKDSPPRAIANDGGQRRIGSGWGVETAPLDLDEWVQKREIYHTGKIVEYYDQNDLVVIVADITPAYTNAYSGKGTFSHRTRRVEKYWRTLVYDRANDTVAVYDNLIASDRQFRKRSLFHTVDKPFRTSTGFATAAQPNKYPSKNSGYLEAAILFPENANITVTGGKGMEFLVEGTNYDEKGEVWKKVDRRRKNRPEPGLWRIEISPSIEKEHDRFLTILKPLPDKQGSGLQTKRLATDNAIGGEISGPGRTLRMLFPNNREGVIIEILGKSGATNLDLSVPDLVADETTRKIAGSIR